jgi:hypothetical protein
MHASGLLALFWHVIPLYVQVNCHLLSPLLLLLLLLPPLTEPRVWPAEQLPPVPQPGRIQDQARRAGGAVVSLLAWRLLHTIILLACMYMFAACLNSIITAAARAATTYRATSVVRYHNCRLPA